MRKTITIATVTLLALTTSTFAGTALCDKPVNGFQVEQGKCKFGRANNYGDTAKAVSKAAADKAAAKAAKSKK